MTLPQWKRERDASREVPPSEFNLVRRLHAGDASALEELMATYWRPLVLYVGRLLDDDVDAGRDVAQETFVRLWEMRAELEPGSLKAYLYRLTRNLALDEFRRRAVRNRWRAESDGEEWRPPTPLQLVEREELGRAVSRAIDALPPRRREVFTLAYLHRLSYCAIADVMGISPATVKNQLATALADLRQALQGSR
jgi:RNA polymerase sigma-70 factor (ECF subfamily)